MTSLRTPVPDRSPHRAHVPGVPLSFSPSQGTFSRGITPSTPIHRDPNELPGRFAADCSLPGEQHTLGSRPAVRAARGLSLFGEHAARWFALDLLGAAVPSHPARVECPLAQLARSLRVTP